MYNGYQQGEGDTAYDDPAVIREKVEVDGLQGADELRVLVIDGSETNAGVYEDRIEVTGFSIGNDGEHTDYYSAKTFARHTDDHRP